ncbi:MAG: tetratricopeptide repeat protein [Peptoniphilaceae bacterium]|nr:tetratricopeptide repeat protein [Peptoniphilaceae bacterium]MDD7383274.1 tetratricopeptide repeat protein [Peptoniphilaceae bacterium]MDY3738355.1 tetratricopeptide repeat protein [Peptoniphilaceae bacterium]
MTQLDKFFKQFTNNLVYIDIKKESEIEALKGLTVPIYTKDLTEQIISGDAANSIKIDLIFEGMLVNIALDWEFPYTKEYLNVLNNSLKDPTKFATTQALKIYKKDFDKALFLFRAGNIINPFDNYTAYCYAKFLWNRSVNEKEYQKEMLKESIRILQEILSRDENFSSAYFELGNIYKNMGQFVKARNYFNTALHKENNELYKQEIRENLEYIEDDAEIEESKELIEKSNNEKAIKKLSSVISKSKRHDAYYLLAVAYQNVENYKKASENFKNSLDSGGESKELYNDYAISEYMLKNTDNAIKLLELGLNKYEDDPRMLYNKIQLLVMTGNLKEAKDDINRLLSYDDISDELFNNLMIIKETYNL